MIFDKQPIAHVQPLSVDRDLLARQRVQDHDRHQLFGEMIGAVVVGTIGQDDGKAVGFMPGADQMIAGRLGGGIGRSGIIGRGFREHARRTQRSKNLIG